MTAEPQPANVSQNVPIASAKYFLIWAMSCSSPVHVGRRLSRESRQRLLRCNGEQVGVSPPEGGPGCRVSRCRTRAPARLGVTQNGRSGLVGAQEPDEANGRPGFSRGCDVSAPCDALGLVVPGQKNTAPSRRCAASSFEGGSESRG